MQKSVIFICTCFFVFFGCKTVEPGIHNNGSGTTAVRDAVSELAGKQAESGIRAERITAASGQAAENHTDITNRIDTVIEELASGTTDDKRFDELCERIRNRHSNGAGQSGEDTAETE